MATNLKDKIVIVIGGSSGIGKAFAQLAHGAGARVIIAGRSKERLQQTACELGNVQSRVVDLTDDDSVRALFAETPIVHHLVITGPGPGFGAFLERSVADAKADFEAKFWGQYRAVLHAAPRIPEDGSIVLMSGAYSQRPVPGSSTLAAIQAGLEGLVRALAVELSPRRVNIVVPGLTDTPLIHGAFPEQARIRLYEESAKSLPAKRIGTSEDIAEAIMYLTTNRYVTGTSIFVDGGYLLR